MAPIYMPLRNLYTIYWYKLHIFLFEKSGNYKRLNHYKEKLENEMQEQKRQKEIIK